MAREKKVRKYYKKPQVYQVKLEIDEAVLLGCKQTKLITAQGSKNCSHPTCLSLGS